MTNRPLPVRLAPLINSFIDQARDLLATDGYLTPVAFIWRSDRPPTDMVTYALKEAGDKDAAADAVRQIARVMEADFVFLIMEAWMLDPTHARRYNEILDRYGSIGASPYAIDSVCFSLETHEGTWMGQVRQKPLGLSKKRKTFGPVEMRANFDVAEGRFFGLLPPPRGAQMN